MARENQGLQIALIIFVMLTIILGVTTFLYVRQYKQAADAAAKYEDEAKTQNDAATKIQGEYNNLKLKVGGAATDTAEAIDELFREDMKQHVPSLPENQWSYREALRVLSTTIQAKNESLTRTETANQQLQARIEQLEDSKAPLVAQQTKRALDAEALRAKERTAYNDARALLEAQQKKQLRGFVQSKQTSDQQMDALKTQFEEQQARNQELEDLLKQRNDQIIEIIEPTFEMADGKIRWVNQRNQTVWINLGRADALQRLTSFSVYPADTNDVTKVGKKASIEVTQILGDHLAEARIVEDEPGNPVMPGDVIHTPVWAPGEREHFVLTDGMDLDDDGKSDLQTVIHIITMNGGVVDCYVTDEGERHGDFTSKSRYLVMGNDPDETASPERLAAHGQILRDAEQRGLMKITLKDLLDKMGWKNQAPVVRYGLGANPNQFRAQPPEEGLPVSTGTVSPLFQPRRPPRAARGSAY
jgi:hypothetical protein